MRVPRNASSCWICRAMRGAALGGAGALLGGLIAARISVDPMDVATWGFLGGVFSVALLGPRLGGGATPRPRRGR